jgi:putative toxin-antitoxin system antitoxin component (TIGR02293 family)
MDATVVKRQRRIAGLLAKYKKLYANAFIILQYSKKGLKAQAVFDFISISEFPHQSVEHLLQKSVKTFTNYKEQNTLLDPTISEKLLKLFALYDKGVLVFGSLEEFNKWMGEPAFGLGNQVPSSLLDTITGIDLVEEELARIEYGDLA